VRAVRVNAARQFNADRPGRSPVLNRSTSLVCLVWLGLVWLSLAPNMLSNFFKTND